MLKFIYNLDTYIGEGLWPSKHSFVMAMVQWDASPPVGHQGGISAGDSHGGDGCCCWLLIAWFLQQHK